MAKQLCKSHITRLRNVAQKLVYVQKMDGTQLILGVENRDKMERAAKMIYDATNLLEQVK